MGSVPFPFCHSCDKGGWKVWERGFGNKIDALAAYILRLHAQNGSGDKLLD